MGELTGAVGMAQPAVSHQLRILRDLGLVVGSRDGRHTMYGLYDPHVAVLLDEALRHIEHRKTGSAQAPQARPAIPPHDNQPARSIMSQEHAHEDPHTHEHEHDGETHAHTSHEHEHVEHEHAHAHDGEHHAHPHVHEAGLEEVHEHEHV